MWIVLHTTTYYTLCTTQDALSELNETAPNDRRFKHYVIVATWLTLHTENKMVTSKLTGFNWLQIQRCYLVLLNQPKYKNVYIYMS